MLPDWLREMTLEDSPGIEARQEGIDARERIRRLVTPEVLKLLDAHGWPRLKRGMKRRRLLSSEEKRDRVRLEMLKNGELK